MQRYTIWSSYTFHMPSVLFYILIVPGVNLLLQILLNWCVPAQILDMSAHGIIDYNLTAIYEPIV
jgi:hypothetical protein